LLLGQTCLDLVLMYQNRDKNKKATLALGAKVARE